MAKQQADSIGADRTEAAETGPLYLRIRDALAGAIAAGRLPKGALLLEGHVAGIFSSTRTPVRQAFALLEAAGAIRRFEGRGFIVGPGREAPRRIALTAEMFGDGCEAQALRKVPAWEAIYEALEREMVHLSVFGRHRINEVELARAKGVGRQVARDALTRLESLGIVEKDDRMRWTVVPLDETRMRDLHDIRVALEPVALRQAFPLMPEDERAAMTARLKRALAGYPDLSLAEMDGMETDLHITLLGHCPNREILIALRRARFMLNVSKHIMGVSHVMPQDEPFISEHLVVFATLEAGDVEAAAEALRHHIAISLPKVIGRVTEFRAAHRPEVPAYVGDIGH
ncbi:GntR family transcriptional regulator [Rhizobium sp. TRM96647]|uniref:GntR family transcriptional regulator n=1 Tax=unclassified Rhizobium TaxID=2613769 RepID=UPI0021E84F8C|nr:MULTISPECIES: GntR family transcriptional regulator [unclassified Rhizobium]MCV3735960.1 GntR family transcriptional regulator [Rhizobium sp. TRM96647]MCV3758378.1 GntR family transcriptional regulator [Rhizobium sp. TRM96650]